MQRCSYEHCGKPWAVCPTLPKWINSVQVLRSIVEWIYFSVLLSGLNKRDVFILCAWCCAVAFWNCSSWNVMLHPVVRDVLRCLGGRRRIRQGLGTVYVLVTSCKSLNIQCWWSLYCVGVWLSDKVVVVFSLLQSGVWRGERSGDISNKHGMHLFPKAIGVSSARAPHASAPLGVSP